MKHIITLIPGDGTGHEITAATKRVVEATGVDIEWDIVHAGAEVYESEGTVLPEKVLESLRKKQSGTERPPYHTHWHRIQECKCCHAKDF
jgi:isocitrate dehydrogenase (NAD+)